MRLTAHLYVRLPLLISIVLGVVCFFLLPAHLGTLQRVLIGWNTLAWPYLIFMGKRIKWLILPLHESETDRHLIGLSG
ncbi:hypothetical protein POW16_14805, partial [Raoultella planticola]